MTLEIAAARVAEAAARNYLSAEEVMAWIDTTIEGCDQAPFWLLEVATRKAGAAEMAALIRPHVPALGFEEKARIAANAFVRDRPGASPVFEAMTRLWVESFVAEDSSSALPESIESLLVEHDHFPDDERLPADFPDRFETAVRVLAEESDAFPFPAV